jgi:carbamate kinase
LQADALLLLTDVVNVERDYGTPTACAIGKTTVESLRREDFAAGSMGPKVDGACRFVEITGNVAAIGTLADAVRILDGEAGTIVYPSKAAAAAAIASPNQPLEVRP